MAYKYIQWGRYRQLHSRAKQSRAEQAGRQIDRQTDK